MPLGPGKYDALCTHVRVQADARAAIVVVMGGNEGNGFAVQALGEDITASLPALLRSIADEIEASLKGPTL